jgi:3-methyladenine DNA glycosylase AlkD
MAGTRSMNKTAAAIRAQLRALANPRVAADSARFFKTGPNGYGRHDRFLGIRVPELRRVARENRDAPLRTALTLLRSRMHEERLLALVLMVDRFARGAERERAEIYDRYLEHTPRHVNNWDLVDCSAHRIVGAYLEGRDRAVLYELARSPSLWQRRVAILATFWYIKRDDFGDTLAISELLLADREDLIHKAVGWMLREVGNRHPAAAERFLRKHCAEMPRTMLRYAIEKLPEHRRRAYLDAKTSRVRRAERTAAGRASA